MTTAETSSCKTCLGSYGLGYTCPGCGVEGKSVDIYDRFQAVCADRDALKSSAAEYMRQLEGWRPVIDAARDWHTTMTERNADFENNAPTREQYEAHDESVRRLLDAINTLTTEKAK